jgi:hypothetical protein
MTRRRWNPTCPEGLLVWQESWRTLIDEDGPSTRLVLRSLRTVLNELVFQARLDRLAHPSARSGLRDDLEHVLRARRKSSVVVPPEADICLRLLGDTKAPGFPHWRTIESLATIGIARLGLDDACMCVREISEAITAAPSGELWGLFERNSSSLIADLLALEYSAKFVSRVPAMIADGYMQVGEDRYITSFPTSLVHSKANIGVLLESLTWAERLSVIVRLLEIPRAKLRVTFQLRGIRVGEPLAFGSAVIYDPFLVTRISKAPQSIPFGQEGNEETRYPNMEIEVDGREIDPEGSFDAAAAVAARHLDVLSANVASAAPLDLQMSSYVVTAVDGEWLSCGSHTPRDTPWLRYHEAANLNEVRQYEQTRESLRRVEGLLRSSVPNRSESKLSFALAAMRRGDDARDPQDSLTSYWSCLEAMLDVGAWSNDAKNETAVALAERVLAPVCFLGSERFRVGWRLHDELCAFHRGCRFAADLAARAFLEPDVGETMRLQSVLSALPDIRMVVAAVGGPHAPHLLQHVDYVTSFYSNAKFAFEHLDRYVQHVRYEVRLAYRHRNRIVHDACDTGPFLQAISARLGIRVRALLHFALSTGSSGESFRRRLSELEARYEVLRVMLSSDQMVDLIAEELIVA